MFLRHNPSLSRALLFACLLIPVTCPGQENEDERLSRFKAAFIYHFIDYIRWPPETQDNFFRIGVLGDSRIVETLREISKKTKSVRPGP